MIKINKAIIRIVNKVRAMILNVSFPVLTPVAFVLTHVLTDNEAFLVTLVQLLMIGWLVVLLTFFHKNPQRYLLTIYSIVKIRSRMLGAAQDALPSLAMP